MTKGQEQLQAAAEAIAAILDSGKVEGDAASRLRAVQGLVEEVRAALFIKSALSVPFTAACSRGAKSLAEAAQGGGSLDVHVEALERAVQNLKDRSTGAGGVIIT